MKYPNENTSRAPSPIALVTAWLTAIGLILALIGYGAYLVIALPPSLFEPPAPQAAGCFTIDDGALTFRPDRWDGDPVLTIPDTVDGQNVTALAPGCFRDCSDLTTIILPETLTAIGAEAFSGCAKLRGLYLPEGMDSIGKDAFAGCAAMEAICIPTTVTTIAAGAFDDCAGLRYINYGGDFLAWSRLYDDYITPFTVAVCVDGSYHHGVPD